MSNRLRIAALIVTVAVVAAIVFFSRARNRPRAAESPRGQTGAVSGAGAGDAVKSAPVATPLVSTPATVAAARTPDPRLPATTTPGPQGSASVPPAATPAAQNAPAGTAPMAAQPADAAASKLEREAAAIELDKVTLMLRDFRTIMGENPTGTNAEIMKAIMGGNPKGARLGPPENQTLNGKGELVDRWGTPIFFHQLSKTNMEVRSAGPDRVMFTEDDVIAR